MKVHDLTREAGNFESYVLDTGRRSIRFWSYSHPERGDLVVIQRDAHKVCYRIDSEASYRFQGSDGNMFWSAEMQDVAGNFGPGEVAAIRAAGLA